MRNFNLEMFTEFETMNVVCGVGDALLQLAPWIWRGWNVKNIVWLFEKIFTFLKQILNVFREFFILFVV